MPINKSFSIVGLAALILIAFGAVMAPRYFAPRSDTTVAMATSTATTTVAHAEAPAPSNAIVAQAAPAIPTAPTPAQAAAAMAAVATSTSTTTAQAVPDGALSDRFGFTAAHAGTVLSIMEEMNASGTVRFTQSTYPGLGTFIESINGRSNFSGHYWFLYVNGKSSSAGASQATLNAGDIVEWRYE